MANPDPNNYYDALMLSIHDIQEYIRYSEMGGELDFDDPWAPLWSSLRELMLKVSDEKEFAELSDKVLVVCPTCLAILLLYQQ